MRLHLTSMICYYYLITLILFLPVISIKGKLMVPYKRRFFHFAPVSNEESCALIDIENAAGSVCQAKQDNLIFLRCQLSRNSTQVKVVTEFANSLKKI